MFAAKHYGFDMYPMHVHNVPQVRELFNIPSHLEPVMRITAKASIKSVRVATVSQ